MNRDADKPAKAASDAARDEVRTDKNAARAGRRKARQDDPEVAELLDGLSEMSVQAEVDAEADAERSARDYGNDAKGRFGKGNPGRPKGRKTTSVWERLRNRLAQQLYKLLLKDDNWFENLSEHTQMQLLKIMVPASKSVETDVAQPKPLVVERDMTFEVVFDDLVTLPPSGKPELVEVDDVSPPTDAPHIPTGQLTAEDAQRALYLAAAKEQRRVVDERAQRELEQERVRQQAIDNRRRRFDW